METAILWRLRDGVRRFGELQRLLPGVTRKVLAQQLRELERDDIIARKVYGQVPPKVEYSLTQYGLTLRRLLSELCDWGSRHERHVASERGGVSRQKLVPVPAAVGARAAS